MSVQRALDHIDFLLDVLNEADRQIAQEKGTSISGVQFDASNVKYFESTDAVKTGITVRVTTDINLLNKEWKECGLGSHSELKAFLGQVGKVTEIEDDDDTLQLRWENYDTCWIPVRVCFDAKGAKETLPGMANSWLGDSKQAEKEVTVSENLFTGVEDDGVKVGNHIQVTKQIKVLENTWKEAELGPNDTKNIYLGTIGKIIEIEEDDDTVQLQWANFDTVWIPIKACQDASGQEATIPSATVSWLS